MHKNLHPITRVRQAISMAAVVPLIAFSGAVVYAAEASDDGSTARTVAAASTSTSTTSTTTESTSTTETTTTKTELTSARPKIALALGGGGTRGAAHVGVLRVLEREGIHVDMITGTSIGAIVGGLYCAGLSVNDIEKRFRKPKLMKSYMTVPVFVSIAARPLFLVPRLVGWKPFDGFYFGNKFRNYYKSCLPPDRRNIEDLKIPFSAMTTNLRDGKPFPITHGDLSRAVQASSAIPVLRRAVRIDEQVLVDGCVVINVPVDEAQTMGADIIIAVPVNERLELVPADTFRHVGSVARRIEQILLARTDAPQLSRADVVIHPVTDGIDVVSTNPKDAVRAIQAGVDAANQAMPEIRRRLKEWSARHEQH
ncbi:MAG TPA: patatin-like phospholipase family protein [Oculatellaceae cyanobacterium]